MKIFHIFVFFFSFETAVVISNRSSNDRSLFDPDLIRIPDHILKCYTDRDLWRRYSRLPASVDNLVALIRKAELHPRMTSWSPSRMASTLLRRFRFDGIHYDGCVDTSTGALPFIIDMQDEHAKMCLVRELLSESGSDPDDFPEDALTLEEACSLHWTLSYSVNTTFREDEFFWMTNYEENKDLFGPYPKGSNDQYEHGGEDHYSDHRPPLGSPGQWVAAEDTSGKDEWGNPVTPNIHRQIMGRTCHEYRPVSQAPWEVGAVWHESGPLAAGAMMAGLAAGLQPQMVMWDEGQADNAYGASLAGDLGQTALLKQRDEPYVGPDGYFNSTICPAEFYLRSTFGETGVFSHLTIAEVNGGLDGLVMAQYADEWERKSEMTLSQIINMYYSVYGIRYHGEQKISACERYSNYYKLINSNTLSEQAFIFGAELRNALVVPLNNDGLRASIALAKEKLDTAINILDKSLNDFGPCKLQREREGYNVDAMHGFHPSPIDDEAISVGIADVAVVLDTSLYLFEDQVYLKRLAAGIIAGLDIWTTKDDDDNLIAGGSTVEVVDGRYAKVIVSSEKNDFANKANLACQLLRADVPQTGDLDPAFVLENVASRIHTRQNEVNDLRAQVIVLILFGQVPTGDLGAFNDAVYRVRRLYPSVHLLIATRWASPQEFYEFVLYPDFDVFALSLHNDEELRAEIDAARITNRIAQIPASVMYNNCDENTRENQRELFSYAIPDTQRFLMIQPHYFDTSDQLVVELDVEYNGAEICSSRASPEEIAMGKSREEAYEVFENGHWHHYDPYQESTNTRKNKRKRKKNQKGEDFLTENCQNANGANRDSVEFVFNDPCGGESYTRCSPIYFRIEGSDDGGGNCLTDDRNPCRTATSALITITHKGMVCAANANQQLSVYTLILVTFLLYVCKY